MKRVGDARVSPSEAAKLLGVGVDRVRAWCESGELPSYYSIHRWRTIDRKDLIAFAQSHPEVVARKAKESKRDF